MSTITVLARWDARALWRDRWFLTTAATFGLLTLAASAAAFSSASFLGVSSFGRVAATLVHLAMLFIPLLGLTVGAGWISGERESGALALVLAQPVDRGAAFAGKYLGVARGLIGATLVGFGSAGLLLALRTGPDRLLAFLWLVGLSLLLALASLSIGFMISSSAGNRSRALATALVLWLMLTLVSDLGVLATSIILRLPAPAVLVFGALNPVSAFRLAAIVGIAGSAELAGPVGVYAADILGVPGMLAALTGVLIAWIAGAFLYGRRRFTRFVDP